ncbi:hypothetical protein [Streptomyces sp. NPDC096033]
MSGDLAPLTAAAAPLLRHPDLPEPVAALHRSPLLELPALPETGNALPG